MRLRAWTAVALMSLAWAAPLGAQPSPAATESGALLRSLILPGWGHKMLGERTSGRRLALAEAALWLTYAVTAGAAGWLEQDYRAYAILHAGIDYADLPDSDIYYFRLGQFDSMQEYNEAQLRLRSPGTLYPLGSGIDWRWDPTSSTERYNQLYKASRRAAKAASFTLGGMVLNRAIAAIHVLIVSRPSQPPAAAWLPLEGGGRLLVWIPL